MSPKIQLTIKLRIEKGILFEPTWGLQPRKQILKKLLEFFQLLEAKGTVLYIFDTKDHTSKWHTDILHKVQGYTVQVSMYKEISRSPWPPKELEMSTIF